MTPPSFCLTELQTDALREITNIGTGNAITALSSIVTSEVGMSTPSFGLVTIDGFRDILGAPEAHAAAVLIPIAGDIAGYVAYVFSEAGAFSLVDRLLGQESGTTVDFGELEQSAVMEAGNIVAGSFLTALCEMTGLAIACEPPGFACDMVASVLQCLGNIVPTLGDHAVTIVTEMNLGGENVEGVFAVIPEPGTLNTLFAALGVAAEEAA